MSNHERISPGLKWFTILNVVMMFFVVLGGALVTKTGSGAGCGKSWPLCEGSFLPLETMESYIEYSHRVVSGAEWVFVFILLFWIRRVFPRDRELIWLATGAVVFTCVQALMGAAAVIWYQAPPVMALHMGFSLLAFTGVLLVGLKLWERSRFSVAGEGEEKVEIFTSIPRFFRNAVWAVTIYSYMVVYLGAYVRHTGAGGGCVGWPLCNGEFIPTLSGTTGVQFVHRLAAAALFFCVLFIFYWIRNKYQDRHDLYWGAWWAILLVTMQVLSGGLMVLTNLGLVLTLLHTTIICGLFGMLSYLSIQVGKPHFYAVEEVVHDHDRGRSRVPAVSE